MGKTEENRGTKKRAEEEPIEAAPAPAAIWDCGSPLYDSFELVSLNHLIERHLMTLPYMGSKSNRVSPSDDGGPAGRLVESVKCRCDEKGSWSIMRILAGFLGRKKKDERKIKTRKFGCYKF